MTGFKILETLKQSEKTLRQSACDCGTCPVTMACAINRGGNGWKFDCCGATAVEIEGDNHVMLIMDCGVNQFEQENDAAALTCPLCTGDVIEWALRGNMEGFRYVPTVHAKVPIKTRLDKWKKCLPIAKERLALERARLGEG